MIMRLLAWAMFCIWATLTLVLAALIFPLAWLLSFKDTTNEQ
jgi:hypothetical protein